MKITLSILCLFFIISCGQDKATDKTIEKTTEQAPATNTDRNLSHRSPIRPSIVIGKLAKERT
jgi:hypothetical protein